MGLKEKLSNISQQISAEKQLEAEAQKTEELKPIRLRVKELEKNRVDLEMIKNSLDFKKDYNARTGQGIGMKDYAENTIAKKAKIRGDLEKEVKANPEAMRKLGIGNVDELVSHPNLSEEDEIVAYKEALSQQEDLVLSDTKLKNRLVKLGIKMDDKNFSYESASQEIGRRLVELDGELLSENLKTPEGKEKILNNLTEEFAKNTPGIFFEGSSIRDKNAYRDFNDNKPDAYYQFAVKGSESTYQKDVLRVEFFGDKSFVPNPYHLSLVPKNFQEQADKYGVEICTEALKKNYQDKIKASFLKTDENADQVRTLRASMESVNPKKRNEAVNTLRDFENKKREVLNALQSKSEELKSKGIDFSPKYASGYGTEYENIFKLAGWRKDSEDVLKNLRENKLFPDYDFDKLTDFTKNVISNLDKVLEVIKNIKDEKTAHEFLYEQKHDNYIGNFHKRLLVSEFEESTKFKNPKGLRYQSTKTLSDKFSSYDEAVRYLDQEIKDSDEAMERIDEKVADIVDLGVANLELSAKHKTDSHQLKSTMEGVERARADASIILSEIASLQEGLSPDEELQVYKGTVELVSKMNEAKRLSDEMKLKEEQIKDKGEELDKEQGSEPWFGKEKWRARVTNLKKELDEIKQEKTSLKTSYDENARSRFLYLNLKNVSSFSQPKQLVEKFNATGKPGVIFEGLKSELMKLVDKEVPADAKRIYDKIKSLEDSLIPKNKK